tara:strand:+ start:314 stop:1069 length:756 start_codon:yes stop_codon:yes gene_type:complete
MTFWFDSHCHLESNSIEAIRRARSSSVVGMVTVGTDLDSSQTAIGLARVYPDVWATAGVHPHEARHGLEGIADLLNDETVIAVGEAGLDYHYDHSPRNSQINVFAAQIDLANKRDMPLVIHTRKAWDETFAVLDKQGVPKKTVFHCFTGGPDEAQSCLERGAFLSFSGILTFPNAEMVRAAAMQCPLDRVVIETDSPFLSPVPHRGKVNEPANVGLVGEQLATLMNLTVDEVSAATTFNAQLFYGLEGLDN